MPNRHILCLALTPFSAHSISKKSPAKKEKDGRAETGRGRSAGADAEALGHEQRIIADANAYVGG